jgi:hypothetical protein
MFESVRFAAKTLFSIEKLKGPLDHSSGPFFWLYAALLKRLRLVCERLGLRPISVCALDDRL